MVREKKGMANLDGFELRTSTGRESLDAIEEMAVSDTLVDGFVTFEPCPHASVDFQLILRLKKSSKPESK